MTDEKFVEMYHETYYVLYRYVSARIFDKNLIEDIIQETYQTAFEKEEILKGHDNITGWLILTAKHKMQKMYSRETRQNSTRVGMDEYLFGETASGGEDEISLLELETVLEKNLSEEERTLLYRYYMDGYTSQELMELYSISLSCLKMRLKRIRDKIAVSIS